MKNILNIKMCRALLVHVFVMAWLCGCSGEEALYSFGRSEQAEEMSGRAEGLSEAQVSDDGEEKSKESDALSVLYVHVCGAVRSPGVVQIPSGSRAEAAVDAAGGFTEDADTAYVNLAAPIGDGEQLYIPTKEEAQELIRSQKTAQSGIVNLNTADASLLSTLPGIGESRARDIISYRQQNGAFTDPEQIMRVPGIKASTYEKIKNLITVS